MNNLLESVLIGVWIRTQSYYYSVVVTGFLLVCKEEKAFILIRHDKTKSGEYVLDKYRRIREGKKRTILTQQHLEHVIHHQSMRRGKNNYECVGNV